NSSIGMSGWFWLCTFLGLLALDVDGKSDVRNYWVIIEKITLKRIAKEYVNDINCVLTQRHNNSIVDCNLILQRNVKNIKMEVYLDMMRPNTQNLRLFNTQLEVCEFWTLAHKNPLLNILTSTFTRVIDSNIKCPLRAHFNYSVHHWHMDESDFPSYIPECQLKGNTKFFTNNKMALIMNFLGSIVHNK
ncbi:hypothetical protein KR215_003644, partial [Drosophila sulfurigaster]